MKILLLTLALSGALAAERLPRPYQSSVQARKQLDDMDEPAQLLRLARITPAQAKAIARRIIPDGVIKEVELENHGGGVVYEVEILQSEVEFEVIIDAGTGEVLFLESEEDSD